MVFCAEWIKIKIQGLYNEKLIDNKKDSHDLFFLQKYISYIYVSVLKNVKSFDHSWQTCLRVT